MKEGFENVGELIPLDRRDGEAVASLQNAKVGERRVVAKRLDRDDGALGEGLDVNREPPGIVFWALRIEVVAFGIELQFVGIGGGGDFRDAYDAGFGAARVIKEHGVAHRHVVTDEVSRLIIADAEPRDRLVRSREGVVDGTFPRFGLHQPKAAGLKKTLNKVRRERHAGRL